MQQVRCFGERGTARATAATAPPARRYVEEGSRGGVGRACATSAPLCTPMARFRASTRLNGYLPSTEAQARPRDAREDRGDNNTHPFKLETPQAPLRRITTAIGEHHFGNWVHEAVQEYASDARLRHVAQARSI